MKRYFYLIVTLLIGFVTISSCSNDDEDKVFLDGTGAPMVWTSNGNRLEGEGHVLIKIPKEGGIYSYICTNYSPWGICEGFVIENDVQKYIIVGSKTITNIDWVNIDYKPELNSKDCGGYLTANFSPNTTRKKREIAITLVAGNIYHTFYFEQEAGE